MATTKISRTQKVYKKLDLDSLPAGYRFVPLEGELIVEYLKKKLNNEPLPPNKIMEVMLYKHSPEQLEAMYHHNRRETNMFFFTQRDRKHQHGSRPNRNTGSGCWKASGADKPVRYKGEQVGFKKTLVFYRDEANCHKKTNWIMHEFRVNDLPPTKKCATDMKLDWVLCRIRERVPKPSTTAPYQVTEEYSTESNSHDNVNEPMHQDSESNSHDNVNEPMHQDSKSNSHDNVNEPMRQDSENIEVVDSQKSNIEIPEAVASTDDLFDSLEPICPVPTSIDTTRRPPNSFMEYTQPSTSMPAIYAYEFQVNTMHLPQNSFMEFTQPSNSMPAIHADKFQTNNMHLPQDSFMKFTQPSTSMPTIYADEFQTLNASYGAMEEEMVQSFNSMPPLLKSSMNPLKSSYMGNEKMWDSTSTAGQDGDGNYGYPSWSYAFQS